MFTAWKSIKDKLNMEKGRITDRLTETLGCFTEQKSREIMVKHPKQKQNDQVVRLLIFKRSHIAIYPTKLPNSL